jgi:hypothetical protein
MRGAFTGLHHVLSLKKDFSDETKSLLKNHLRETIRGQELSDLHSADTNNHLGHFHRDIIDILSCNEAKFEHLKLSEGYLIDALRLYTINYGPNHLTTLDASSNLLAVSIEIVQMPLLDS